MIIPITRQRTGVWYRALSAFTAAAFGISTILPARAYAQAGTGLPPAPAFLGLPVPGAMVSVTGRFTPALVKGMTVHPEDPLKFDFIVTPGDSGLEGEALNREATRMIKYFLAAVTVPQGDLWVNLSPYEADRVIPAGFGDTEMGRDLLAQDYLLKQLTASLMYPEDELGKAFWDRVHTKAYEQFGTTDIPTNTFNKIWIVPEKAVVYERDGSAFVVENRLKVMLDSDYLSLRGVRQRNVADDEANDIETGILREILIPAIEAEVNEGKTFASLRQMFNAMILAAWYKQRLKDSLLGRIYMDQNKTLGVDTQDKQVNDKIYAQYIEAFKKGVYNYIREDFDPAIKATIPRKYFSGGANMASLFETAGSPVGATGFAGSPLRIIGDQAFHDLPSSLRRTRMGLDEAASPVARRITVGLTEVTPATRTAAEELQTTQLAQAGSPVGDGEEEALTLVRLSLLRMERDRLAKELLDRDMKPDVKKLFIRHLRTGTPLKYIRGKFPALSEDDFNEADALVRRFSATFVPDAVALRKIIVENFLTGLEEDNDAVPGVDEVVLYDVYLGSHQRTVSRLFGQVTTGIDRPETAWRVIASALGFRGKFMGRFFQEIHPNSNNPQGIGEADIFKAAHAALEITDDRGKTRYRRVFTRRWKAFLNKAESLDIRGRVPRDMAFPEEDAAADFTSDIQAVNNPSPPIETIEGEIAHFVVYVLPGINADNRESQVEVLSHIFRSEIIQAARYIFWILSSDMSYEARREAFIHRMAVVAGIKEENRGNFETRVWKEIEKRSEPGSGERPQGAASPVINVEKFDANWNLILSNLTADDTTREDFVEWLGNPDAPVPAHLKELAGWFWIANKETRKVTGNDEHQRHNRELLIKNLIFEIERADRLRTGQQRPAGERFIRGLVLAIVRYARHFNAHGNTVGKDVNLGRAARVLGFFKEDAPKIASFMDVLQSGSYRERSANGDFVNSTVWAAIKARDNFPPGKKRSVPSFTAEVRHALGAPADVGARRHSAPLSSGKTNGRIVLDADQKAELDSFRDIRSEIIATLKKDGKLVSMFETAFVDEQQVIQTMLKEPQEFRDSFATLTTAFHNLAIAVGRIDETLARQPWYPVALARNLAAAGRQYASRAEYPAYIATDVFDRHLAPLEISSSDRVPMEVLVELLGFNPNDSKIAAYVGGRISPDWTPPLQIPIEVASPSRLVDLGEFRRKKELILKQFETKPLLIRIMFYRDFVERKEFKEVKRDVSQEKLMAYKHVRTLMKEMITECRRIDEHLASREGEYATLLALNLLNRFRRTPRDEREIYDDHVREYPMKWSARVSDAQAAELLGVDDIEKMRQHFGGRKVETGAGAASSPAELTRQADTASSTLVDAGEHPERLKGLIRGPQRAGYAYQFLKAFALAQDDNLGNKPAENLHARLVVETGKTDIKRKGKATFISMVKIIAKDGIGAPAEVLVFQRRAERSEEILNVTALYGTKTFLGGPNKLTVAMDSKTAYEIWIDDNKFKVREIKPQEYSSRQEGAADSPVDERAWREASPRTSSPVADREAFRENWNWILDNIVDEEVRVNFLSWLRGEGVTITPRMMPFMGRLETAGRETMKIAEESDRQGWHRELLTGNLISEIERRYSPEYSGESREVSDGILPGAMVRYAARYLQARGESLRSDIDLGSLADLEMVAEVLGFHDPVTMARFIRGLLKIYTARGNMDNFNEIVLDAGVSAFEASAERTKSYFEEQLSRELGVLRPVIHIRPTGPIPPLENWGKFREHRGEALEILKDIQLRGKLTDWVETGKPDELAAVTQAQAAAIEQLSGHIAGMMEKAKEHGISIEGNSWYAPLLRGNLWGQSDEHISAWSTDNEVELYNTHAQGHERWLEGVRISSRDLAELFGFSHIDAMARYIHGEIDFMEFMANMGAIRDIMDSYGNKDMAEWFIRWDKGHEEESRILSEIGVWAKQRAFQELIQHFAYAMEVADKIMPGFSENELYRSLTRKNMENGLRKGWIILDDETASYESSDLRRNLDQIPQRKKKRAARRATNAKFAVKHGGGYAGSLVERAENVLAYSVPAMTPEQEQKAFEVLDGLRSGRLQPLGRTGQILAYLLGALEDKSLKSAHTRTFRWNRFYPEMAVTFLTEDRDGQTWVVKRMSGHETAPIFFDETDGALVLPPFTQERAEDGFKIYVPSGDGPFTAETITADDYELIVDAARQPTSDTVAASPVQKGGIDLNAEMLDLQIRRDGNGVPLPLPQQPIADFKIDGFVPIIIQVTPVDLPLLLGLGEEKPVPAVSLRANGVSEAILRLLRRYAPRNDRLSYLVLQDFCVILNSLWISRSIFPNALGAITSNSSRSPASGSSAWKSSPAPG